MSSSVVVVASGLRPEASQGKAKRHNHPTAVARRPHTLLDEQLLEVQKSVLLLGSLLLLLWLLSFGSMYVGVIQCFVCFVVVLLLAGLSLSLSLSWCV